MRFSPGGQPERSFWEVAPRDPISAAVAAVGSFFAEAGAGIAAATGLADATLGGVAAGSLIGTGLEGAAVGALGGGALNAVTGKPILAGIGEGALVGGAVGGFGPAIGGALGGGSAAGVAGDVLAGAGAGALGGATIPGAGGAEAGALGGATSGLLAGASGVLGGTPGASSSPVTGGPGASAAGLAAPTGLGDANPFGNVASDAASASTYGATTGFGAATPAGDIYGGSPGGATTGTSLSTNTSPQNLYTFNTQSDTTAVPASTGTDGFSYSGATAGSDPATLAQAQAGAFPLPPVPPSLDATGSPLDSYPTLGAAQAANVANAADIGGGVTPQNGIFSPGGKFGYEVNPAAGSSPSAPAGEGPGGTYTLAQGATTGGGASTPSSSSSIGALAHDIGSGNFSNLPSDIGDFASKNSGLLLGAGSLGLDVLKGNQTLPGQSQISGIANQLSGQATQLQSYLTNGTLPPGVSTALTQAGASAKAAIRSRYAAQGMSGSSAEVQDLANVDNTLVSQGATIATQLLNQGISEANLAAGLYGQIMNNALQQDNQLSGALATLASNAARSTITVSPSGSLVAAND